MLDDWSAAPVSTAVPAMSAVALQAAREAAAWLRFCGTVKAPKPDTLPVDTLDSRCPSVQEPTPAAKAVPARTPSSLTAASLLLVL